MDCTKFFSKFPLLLGRFLNIAVSAVVPSVSGMSLTDERESIVQIYENGFSMVCYVKSSSILHGDRFCRKYFNAMDR